MSVEAQASIYKCTNAHADVYYNDKPCPITAIEKEMRAVKDPVGGFITAPYSPSAVAKKNKHNPGKKSLGIGGDSTNEDVSSKKTQVVQSSENSLNAASTSKGG